MTFPRGVPMHAFTDLVGWIADGRAVTWGFVVPPGRTGTFALTSDLANPGLDTLRGVGPEEEPLEVYLPDGTARLVDGSPAPPHVGLDGLVETARFTVPMDAQVDLGNATFVVQGLPPEAPSPAALRLRALAVDPSPAHGAVVAPDPDAMEVPVEELEAHYGGTLRLAVHDLHDQWLLERDDGTWLEVQLEDGILEHLASAAHAAAARFLLAMEDLEPEEISAMAEGLGLPADAGDRFDAGPGDYAARRDRTVMALARAVRMRDGA